MIEFLTDYQRRSKTAWYGLVLIVPLVVVYEMLALAINWGVDAELRNGADVLLRLFFELFGLGAPYISTALLPVCILGLWWWQINCDGTADINVHYLILMLIESVFWAIVLLLVLATTNQYLMISTADNALQTAFLAIGAGIYEEVVFRLGMVTALSLFLVKVMHWQKYIAVAGAIIGAAILFSGFHYIGMLGEPFEWNSFVYRGVAGIILGLLFITRGLGITVYAHAIYDIIVLWIRTVT